MASRSLKKEIEKGIKELNCRCNSLQFSFEETKEDITLRNHSLAKGQEGCHFGTFEMILFFDEFSSKEDAYKCIHSFIQGLVAGTKLLDQTAYHNFVMRNGGVANGNRL